ncbi:hypothetical protein [Costertonia aggregata]|uniref:Class I SAM-dependent methyltransferase n=1 Tax=Costertonia aggregata TaxID=343403 RepID=A0A7H9ASF2_9FLAO|nr:hypothetical protein [Costertonia aggregata]QLG46370.1 hypothetical protein HYG79_13770 [Costertonia aggregata]
MSKLFKIYQYLKFNFSATNQHGVHSPFVYSFLTKCIYKKKKYSGNKTTNVLLKSIAYFKIESVYLPNGNNELEDEIASMFPKIKFGQQPFDLIYLNDPEQDIFKCVGTFQGLNDKSMIIIDDVHHSNKKAAWEKLKELQEVIVTIDFFYFGFVFFRKAQVKQHFKIRL